MTKSQIDIEIRTTMRSLETDDIGQLDTIVRSYFKRYNDKVLYPKDARTRRARDRYDKKWRTYAELVEIAIARLNVYIESGIEGFAKSETQNLFLSVAEILVSRNRISLSFLDRDRLCRSLLLFLATTSGHQEDTVQKVSQILSIVPDSGEEDADNNESWIRTSLESVEFLQRLVKNAFGENYKILKGLLSKVSGSGAPDETDSKLMCSTRHNKKCDQFIPIKNSFFIAFPFSRPEIQTAVVKAFQAKFDSLESDVARFCYENETVLCQICQMILSSRFGVYVLTKQLNSPDGKHYPNSNVMLELGLALGTRRKTIVLVEKGTDVPSDLHGYIRIDFDDATKLPEIIAKSVPTTFYSEART
jgi:hypothetical protein